MSRKETTISRAEASALRVLRDSANTKAALVAAGWPMLRPEKLTEVSEQALCSAIRVLDRLGPRPDFDLAPESDP
jgi:capsular polysaccharide biosynthesis protein